jgi:hypothetical protein
MTEEDESGYLFRDGKIINFEEIILKNIDYRRETGALRIRTTSNEINVDFIEEIIPTKEQLNAIRRLKTLNRKIVFEIVNKDNYPLKGQGGFDKTLFEMENQLSEFYKNRLTL